MLRKHHRCERIDVASRANSLNRFFFDGCFGKSLYVSRVESDFSYHVDGRAYQKPQRRELLASYDVVWLRIPPPVAPVFLEFLIRSFPSQLFINEPAGILGTGSKTFLLNFPEICPPMQLCRSPQEALEFGRKYSIVLKTISGYGGQGIYKMSEGQLWHGNAMVDWEKFADDWDRNQREYLAVKYLANVTQGDKRIVVIHGRVMGASLRLAAKGSWLCNASQGGSSNRSEPDPDELKIIERLEGYLPAAGILIYGVDTLVDDDGRRVLSEVNTTSIGGLTQIQELSGRPVIREAADLIWNYVAGRHREWAAS